MMFGSMICRLILSFAILLNLDIFTLANADKISDKRLCGDRNCQTIVSKARTLARHKPTDPAFLPFERGDLIDIYSKSAGSRQDLWGGQLNGRRGYFPRSFVREFKVENPNPQFVIDTEHHVPLEERMRGTQAPSNPRTVKQDNRQQNTPQKAHPEPVIEKKEEEPKGSDNNGIGEPADETDIGDETELADDEPEDRGTETGSEANLESGSQVNTETGTQNNVETGSAVNTDQLTEKETSEQKDEGKETNDVKEDPTEVDETELNDEDTEIDETETDETELEDDDDHVPDEEVKKTLEEKHEDGFIDIDKLPVDTSTDIEDDIDLDAIKEALSAQGSEMKDEEEVDSENKENIDEIQKRPEQTDESVNKGEEIDIGREQTVEEKDVKKEGEMEIEDNTDIDDGEGGSMFGSIWSDNSEGKVEVNEGIDFNHLTHSEQAVNIPNLDINTGDHIEKSETESIKSGDGTLHVNIYNREDKGLEKKDIELDDDSKGKDMIVDEDKDKTKDIEDENYMDKNGTGTVENKDVDIDRDDEYFFNEKDKDDLDETDNNIDLSVSGHHSKDREQKEKESLEPEIKRDENQPPDDILNGVENGNLHLKDILKSSIPEGNDVHQYVVEHVASDTPVPLSESLGTDSLSIEANHIVDKGIGDLPDSQGGNSKDISKDGMKLEVNYGDGVIFGETADGSKRRVADNEGKEAVLPEQQNEDKDSLTINSDQDLKEETELTQSKDDDKLTDNKENINAAGQFIDSGANELVSDNKTQVQDTVKDADTSQGLKSSDTKEDPEGIDNKKDSYEQDVKDIDIGIHENENKDNKTINNDDKEGKVDSTDDSRKSPDEIDSSRTNIEKNSEEFSKTDLIQNDIKGLEEDNTNKTIGTEQYEDDSIKTESNEEKATVDVNRADESKDDGIERNIDMGQDTRTEKKETVTGEESDLVKDTGDIIDEAVVSPFQKKEAENVETKKEDNEENKNVDEPLVDLGTQTVDNTVEDNKSGDTAEGEKPADGIPTDDKGSEENEKFESSEQDNIEKIEADTNAERILDNFEKTLEAMADVKEDIKDVNLENIEGDKDDLKFVDSHGDVIPDHLENEKEKVDIKQTEEIKVPELNVNEMEQSKDSDVERPQVDSNSEDMKNLQKEIDDKKMENLEKLASGMISILATPSYDESKTEFPSTRSDKTVDENFGRGEGTTQVINTEAEISETKVSTDSVTQTVQETLVEEADRNEPVKDDTRGGGVVIDGTTFDADYFGDEMTTANDQATEQIYSTPSVVDNMVQTPLHRVEPTKLFDAPLEIEQTLLPPGTQQPVDNGDNKIPYNQQEEQTTTVIPENIHATETVKEEPVGQESLDVSVLGTSFGYATQKVEEIQTQPIESIIVDSQTQAVDNNETVASDIVQDMVQPSLDQNAYSTEAFISRKPLSTESASAETELPNQGINTESQQVDQGGAETKQGLDQNNNQVIDGQEETKPPTDENNNQLGHGQEGIKQTTDLNNNIPDKDGINSQDGWTDLSREGSVEDTVTAPTTDFPEQLDPYSGVDHLYTRKVPDPDLDEELRLPDDNFMKMLEPYLKSMINMLPPSLQTVLEQEPLGLSPTLTMLVSFISTNVLALLTCVGCLCKGKKKQPGRKDPLVVIRDLEEKLFIATKEKENLEDDIQIKNKKVLEMQDELSSQQSSKGTFETDLKTIKLHNESLKKQLAEVQIELDEYKQEVTEKSQVVIYKDSELQSYLTEIQSQTKRAEDAELALQKISHNCSEREEELRLSLQQVQSLSEQIQQLETSKQQLNTQAGDWSEKVTDLTEQVEQFSSDAKRMQEDLAFKENELEVLRDCFLQVKAFQGEEEMKEDAEDAPDLGEKLKQMMDVSRVNASLRSVEEERDVIQNKLLIEVESRKELEDQVQLLKRKFESNQTDKMKAERQCQEAQTKLEVLSKYFKEKEAELTRQLGEQEVLKNQNISKLQSSDSITQELAKENETYRQQIDDLKTEISKAERDFRSQIAANEKKAHENWLATRAAERELKESRHECGMLRQKLTDLERKLMQGPPPGLIRPITHRAMPPPGMLNGPPPPPPPERPGSRGSVHGHVTPRLRDDDYRASPIGPERLPPHPDRRLPPGPMGPRPPPPPLDAMSPPPYAIRPPFPPDRRSPPSFDRYPPPRGPRPPFPRPPPPHLRSPPPMGSNPSEHDDSKQDPYSRAHPGSRDRGAARHQSQV